MPQRRMLRVRVCETCDHLRGSHYLVVPSDGSSRPRPMRPRARSIPIPCHVVSCECAGFTAETPLFPCPSCDRGYATRTSLEIHLYGRHPELTVRERSQVVERALRWWTLAQPIRPVVAA